jgi:hypothetical protein
MVIEQKLAPAKNFYTGSEQVQEVKSTVRWVCSVSDFFFCALIILIFEPDLKIEVGHK